MDETTKTVGVVPQDTLLSYDGLSFLKAIIAGELPAPPITQTLGFQLAAADHGRAVFEGEPQFRHYNPIGVVHGGFAMTLLDSALGCAVRTAVGGTGVVGLLKGGRPGKTVALRADIDALPIV